ncbi:MAG: hypothetical protein A2293_16440 [Elusimicrobia bacterium RIFOXYB2_FULL_49_7]|nr:MAG: hypothetical protein A2293_16440 [Elusimicrobia bacterium RIFOXYB2_FULL_49_7]
MILNQNYARFLVLHREIIRLEEVAALLSWDQATYMPKGAAANRAEHLSVLSAHIHRIRIESTYAGLVNEVSVATDLTDEEQTQVRLAKRDLDKAVKLPTRLVEALARAASLGKEAWLAARKENQWSLFQENLRELIALQKEVGTCLGFPKDPYTALLDEYEPGLTQAHLNGLFGPLRERLATLVRKLTKRPLTVRQDIFNHEFPESAQLALCTFMSAEMGLPEERTRLDKSAHPFCTSFSLNDVRRTVRFRQNNPFSGLFAVMHENGHALYEMGFDLRLDGTPAGSAVSLGIHESQSRLWENMIGRTLAFFETYHAILSDIFGSVMTGYSPAKLYALAAEVKPSLIRVEADEVTYNLHILLRYDLEQRLFNGSLTVEDLPEAWNNEMESLFGICPTKVTEGALQDIHWCLGSFGYFPTYTLGNLYAAQFRWAIERELGSFSDMIRDRRFSEIRGWLNRNVHCFGRLKSADQVVKDATGEGLNPDYFFKYLEEKYTTLYGV